MEWTNLDAASGTGPSTRGGHAMSAVGPVLYLFGGKSLILSFADLWFIHVPRVLDWPSFGLSSFIRIYDLDSIQVNMTEDALWDFQVALCTRPWLPCSLTIVGPPSSPSTIRRRTDSQISCSGGSGCTGITITHVTVTCSNNVSTSSGLQVSGNGAQLSIASSIFVNCSAVEDGGVVRVYDGAKLTVTNSSFVRSSSMANGGALAIVGAAAIISGSSFTDCSAARGLGGAVWMQGFSAYPLPLRPSTVSFSTCQFLRNTAMSGGAVVVSVRSSTTIQSCTFHGNSADEGGAATVFDHSSTKMASSIFNKNMALGMGGGAIYMSHSPLEMISCTFTDNTAPHGGGGALLWSGDTAPRWPDFAAIASPDGIPATPFPLSDHTRWLCDRNNTAWYGPCVATLYKSLELQGLPTHQRPGYAGVPLELVVLKLDAYGQIITTDSLSTLQLYTALDGKKINDNSVAFLGGSIFSGFQRGRAVFSSGVKPTFVSVSVADGRTELQRPSYLYFKGTDLTTGRIMETDPQQVHLSSGNRTVCPVGSALLLEPSLGSDNVMTDSRPGTCKVCDSGFYNVNPLTGRCLPCPPSAICINGAPPMFGVQKVAGTVEMKLPDDGDDGVRQALADKFGVKAWQLTVLSQPPRRQSTRAAMRGARPTTLATSQTRRSVTVWFELVAEEAQMAVLAVTLPALGVKLSEIKSIGPQAAAGEVWKEVNGVFLLLKCPPGFKRISTPIEMQKCSPCGKGKYIIEDSMDCVDCPVFSLSPPPPSRPSCCILPLWILHTHLLSHSRPGRSRLPRRRRIQAQSRGLGLDGGNRCVHRLKDIQDFCLPRRPCPREDQEHPASGQMRAVPRDSTAWIQYRRRSVDCSWPNGSRGLQTLPSAQRYVPHVRLP
jgi:hypothetical protein